MGIAASLAYLLGDPLFSHGTSGGRTLKALASMAIQHPRQLVSVMVGGVAGYVFWRVSGRVLGVKADENG